MYYRREVNKDYTDTCFVKLQQKINIHVTNWLPRPFTNIEFLPISKHCGFNFLLPGVLLVIKTEQAVQYYTAGQGNLYSKILQDPFKIWKHFTKDFLKKLPKIEANFTNFEVWSSKTELPKIEFTNIEGYQYRGIPVLLT